MALTLSRDIVHRLQRREEAAFREVLTVAGPSMIAFVRSYGQTREDAEDILQTVLMRIWDLGERFAPSVSVEAYLLMSARNEALRVVRSRGIRERHVRRYVADAESDGEDTDMNPLTPVLAREDANTLRRALNVLTEHQRTAFELRYGQRLTIAEIAQVLEITPKGVEHLMTRIKKLLRDYVLHTEK